MANRLKVAVVGCGRAGITNHIPWYAEHPEAELVGLVDADIVKAERCAEKWGGKAYNNLTEMLDKEKPDMVSVATPVRLHRENTVECLRHNGHVLCEKPMAPTLEECQKMVSIAKEKNLILGIVSDRRFDPGYQRARQVILSGEIGKPLFFRVHWVANCVEMWSGGYRVKLETGGGTFQDNGSHFIDLSRWLFDTEVETVQGTIEMYYPEITEVEDQAVAILQFKNGVSGLIETSWVGPMNYRCHGIHQEINETWIYGTEGAVKILSNREPAVVDIWDKKKNEWRIISVPGVPQFYRYKQMINEFVSCVQKKKEFLPSGEDGKKVIAVVLALYQASFIGKKVSLPLDKSPNLSEIFTNLRKERLKEG